MMDLLKRLWKEEEGQGMVEYGLILALVAVALIGALIAMQGKLDTLFGNVETGLEGTDPNAQ